MGLVSSPAGLLIHEKYEFLGQRHWYATPEGGGGGISWNDACTFREALDRCKDEYHDVIHLSPVDHECDNGSDDQGTTVSVKNVRIVAFACERMGNTRLINSAASVAYVLQVTADGFCIEGVKFDQSDQTDDEAVLFRVNGADQGMVKGCRFQQSAGASGTGIQFDSAHGWKVSDCGITGMETYGIKISASQGISIIGCCICSNDTGVYITGATATRINIFDSIIRFSDTLGINIDATTTTDILVKSCKFIHNTANVSDDGDWETVHYMDIEFAHEDPYVYPANAGQQIQTGDGVWTWTAAATQIIPASTVTESFFITGINLQDYNAVQTFKIHLFYGEASADQSLGIYEFTVDAANPNSFIPVNIAFAKKFIPANSIVGAKIMSSTDGVDDITITLSIQEL